ncbi:MAG TPA: hypothetical protein V6C97_32765 [Oculatellaceae cyanobacterium]
MLETELRGRNISFEVVLGAYKGVDQGVSFLILDESRSACELGKKYKQESILTSIGLVYTDGTHRITPARSVLVGSEALAQDFFSTLLDGRSFSVGLDFASTFSSTEQHHNRHARCIVFSQLESCQLRFLCRSRSPVDHSSTTFCD